MVSEYRPCVVVVFTNPGGHVLVCERADVRGAWQLPQGGIEPGESALNAVYREMREELGCDRFKITKEAPGLIKYRFPNDLDKAIAKKWIGQSQVWFRAQFDQGFAPDLNAADGEFISCEWREPSLVVSAIVDWKRDAYKEGLTKLGFSF